MTQNFQDYLFDDKLIFVDKPSGKSSFAVVAQVRRVLSQAVGHKVKVGHTGTLDPFATGLLILLAGKNTKRAADFLGLKKTYLATLKLGFTSSTDDPEGEIKPYQSLNTPEKSSQLVEALSLDQVEGILKQFTGKLMQRPPAFSALHVHGQRAYKLARLGKPPVLPPRPVTIFTLELVSFAPPFLTLNCTVSSGTYIRSLARDLGVALGCGAFLTALRRTAVGDYQLDQVPLFKL